MLIPLQQLLTKFNAKPTGVAAIGAHWGEESEQYLACGIKDIIYVEPCQKAFSVLIERFGNEDNIRIFNYACSDYTGIATMYTGDETVNKGQSNSLLKPAIHLQLHPTVEFTDIEEVQVIELDKIPFDRHKYQLLVMDCQGAEGSVLRGGVETLKHISWVYTEINFGEVYENCTKSDELDQLLHEFERVETGFKVGGLWSDCFYVRKTLLQ